MGTRDSNAQPWTERLWEFLSRPRTPRNSPWLLRCLGLLWLAGIAALLALLVSSLEGDPPKPAWADFAEMFRAGLWPFVRALGVGILVFLVTVFLLVGVTMVGFALLPDLQSEHGWPVIVAVLGLEIIAAVLVAVYGTMVICMRFWG